MIPPLQEGLQTAREFRWLLVAGDWTEDVVEGWQTEISWETAVMVVTALDNAGLFEGLCGLAGNFEMRRKKRARHSGDSSMRLRDLPFVIELADLMAERPPDIQDSDSLIF